MTDTKSQFVTRWKKHKKDKARAAEQDYIAYKRGVVDRARRRKRA